jgi:hypothetical protein
VSETVRAMMFKNVFDLMDRFVKQYPVVNFTVNSRDSGSEKTRKRFREEFSDRTRTETVNGIFMM